MENTNLQALTSFFVRIVAENPDAVINMVRNVPDPDDASIVWDHLVTYTNVHVSYVAGISDGKLWYNSIDAFSVVSPAELLALPLCED